MDHTNFPIAKPIPFEVLKTFADKVDWDQYYGRWGTEELIYADYYRGYVPLYLEGKVTHVWMYHEK